MATVADILRVIDSLAPRYMKEDWDSVGLNCGRLNAPVTKILVALDPFEEACLEAKAFGAELLVTHHPLLWKPGFITDLDEQGRNTLFLIENGIAHVNAHTNLDMAPGGVNDVLAGKLGLSDVRVINPRGTDESGREWGLLRRGTVETQPLRQFLASLRAALGCDALRYADGGKPVHLVAVGGGACGGELMEAAEAGCDTFVTSDLKYNQFRTAYSLGLNLIDAGHFHTENPICGCLAGKLREAFPDIEVRISEKHTDCMKFFR